VTDQFDRLKSALADRYAIERELGSGGMATVYLAEDLKHHRKVAVKVLRPELAAVLGSERFLNEIKVTANLQHPHILPLFDSGETDSFLYYVMPYVEGESLREKLNCEKQLGIDDALKITSEVADALGSAHRQDVVHRDIKPENILLRERHAVVADFGIALAVTAAAGERLTETGLSLGTPAYMSPEQVSGDREIDGRSDIYSLACVLYEMLAGDPPFTASTPRAVLARHVTDPAPPITTVRSSVPQPVAAAIATALGKAPADRFESTKAFSEALFAEAKEAEPEIKSIVVLPFDNLSPEPDQEYFSDGLTEEIITDLSQIHDLLVISRSSAMTFKGTKKKIEDIAKEVNVQYVLEGSVRKAGNNLRITAQLIDATSDAHLWAEKYSGTLDDVFGIQEEVSRSIVEVLKIKLTSEEEQKITVRSIDNVHAYECYLKATGAIYRNTEHAMYDALRYFQLGLDTIGDNALLYSGIAYTYFWLMNIGVKIEEHRAKAEECVQKALALDPDMPKARALLGWLTMFYRGNLENVKEAARHLKRALAADPNDFQALVGLVAVYCYVGKIAVAIPFAERLKQIEPLDPFALWGLGGLYFFDGQYDRALREYRRLYDMDPQHPWWQAWYTLALAYNKQTDEAFTIIDQSANVTPHNMHTKLALMQIHGLKGDKQAALDELTGAFRKWCRERLWSSRIATSFALLNEKEEALYWLEHAVNCGFINYPLLSERDPWLENIRGEKRFKRLIDRVKREWEEFEV
jgi:serine/threonine-protein kinase